MPGAAGAERTSFLLILEGNEQSGQVVGKLAGGVVQGLDSNGFRGDFVSPQVLRNGGAELHGAADTLLDEQGKDRGGVAVLDLALLPFLNGPGGLTDVIHSVAELAQNARVNASRFDGVVQPQ